MNGQDTDLVGGNNAIQRLIQQLPERPSRQKICNFVCSNMGHLEAGAVMDQSSPDQIIQAAESAASGREVTERLAIELIVRELGVGARQAIDLFNKSSNYSKPLAQLHISDGTKAAKVRDMCHTLGYKPRPTQRELLEVLDEQE